MRVDLTDEQEFLREAVGGVIAREAPMATVRSWAEGNEPDAAGAIAARQGWTGIGLAEEHGGQGGGVIELSILAEQLGRGAVPWDLTFGGCLAASLLSQADSEPAHELAAAIAAGEDTAVLCLDGRRPAEPWNEAVLGDGVITLDARYVLGAPRAGGLLVPVAAGEGVALLLVAADASEVTVTERVVVDRTRALADVSLDAAPARPLGTVSRAHWQAVADAAAVLIAADALGSAERMLEMTIAYVVERRQFGVAVGSFQAVKHSGAEMLVDVEASRSAVRYAAWAVDAADVQAGLHAAIAKAYACPAAARVADKALFLHGAIGYTWEHDLQFLFKRAKSDALLFGSADAYRDLIADRLELVERGSTPLPAVS